MVVAVAAAALALLAPAVHAEPQEVIRTAAAGVVEALEVEQEVAMATRGDRVPVSEPTPTYSNYLELNSDYVMTVSSYYSGDKRTLQSYYVCATSMKSLIMTVKFSSNPENGAGDVLMQVANVVGHSYAAKNTRGWYLSVLDDVSADNKYSGYYRLSIQPDKSKATKWYFPPGPNYTPWFKQNLKYMRVRDARGVPQAKDMYLMMPPGGKRDSTSKYLTVGDSGSRVDVELK